MVLFDKKDVASHRLFPSKNLSAAVSEQGATSREGGFGTFRPGCRGTALALGQDSRVSKCENNPDTLPGNFLLCQNNVQHCWDN